MVKYVTRFAPSPTGYLHLGHAFSALTAFDAARQNGGRFILRIEYIDIGRCRPEFEQAIYDDLAWLGLSWETPVRRQSDHFDDYSATLDSLIEKNIVYRCFKTRKEIAAEIARAPHHSKDQTIENSAQYVGAPLPAPEEQSLLTEGHAFAWRLSMSRAEAFLGVAFQHLSFVEETEAGQQTINATPNIFGDVVIARKDFGTSYHLSSVFDDALQNISHIIRGTDLYQSAHLHVLLQALFDYPTPTYQHHRLITDEKGTRLAKRDKAATLRSLREQGMNAKKLRENLGFAW